MANNIVEFNNLKPQWEAIKKEVNAGLEKLYETSDFILGIPVSEFERNFAVWNHSKYAIGVSNATDGLEIAARAFKLEDKKTAVFIPANTFIATFIGIYKAIPNADYYLVDCDEFFQINVSILEVQLAKHASSYEEIIVVPVHLFGCTSDINRILKLQTKFGFKIIEDCSQAHGAISSSNNPVGSDGEIGVFSLYPGKNLGAMGDAGVLTTDQDKYNKRLLSLRNLGSVKKYIHEQFSGNHRLDTIQAIVLNQKLKFIDQWTEQRIEVANRYQSEINNSSLTNFTNPSYCNKNVYHIYPVRVDSRDEFQEYLSGNGIPTLVHYPITLYNSKALLDFPFEYRSENPLSDEYSKTVVSIPMHPFMTKEQIDYVIDTVNKYQCI
jgi:dTDP-4-amino-4,6-dideoxygalactose transaminase